MEFDTLILLLAGAWALLQWLIRGARRAAGEQQEPEAGSDPAAVEDGRQRTLERLQARRRERLARTRARAEAAPPKDAAVEEFRREMERIMGLRTGAEGGPLGRRSGVALEPAEEVEELEPLEVEPEVVSLEQVPARRERVTVDQDDQAEAIVQRRIAAAQAFSRPLTKADHARFDQAIRSAPPTGVKRPVRRSTRSSRELRQALIWSEILGRPVSRR